jgi:hypothetical protein
MGCLIKMVKKKSNIKHIAFIGLEKSNKSENDTDKKAKKK